MDYYTFTIDTNGRDSVTLRDKLVEYEGKRVIFDLDKIICEEQIKIALSRANRAFKMGSQVARAWGIEVLIHLVGDHQIKNAIDLIGVQQHTKRIGVVQDRNELDVDRSREGLDIGTPEQELISSYGIDGEDPCLEIISKGVNVIVDHE